MSAPGGVGTIGIYTVAVWLGLAAALALLPGCAPSASLFEPTARPSGGENSFVVETENRGLLPTRLAPSRPPPTATTNIVAVIPNVVLFPTFTARPTQTPEPPIEQLATTTPRPGATAPTGSRPMFELPTPAPTATRTPRVTIAAAAAEQTRIARLPPTKTPRPVDDLEPNDTRDTATALAIDAPLDGLYISSVDDVDVFVVQTSAANGDLVITVTGNPPAFKIDVLNAIGVNFGRQRFDGTTSTRSYAELTPADTQFYVYVRSLGARLIDGPYTISATLLEPTINGVRLRPGAGFDDVYECEDFPSQAAAQAFLRRYPHDPSELDTNRNGIACESNAAPRDLNPVLHVDPAVTPTPIVLVTATRSPTPTTTRTPTRTPSPTPSPMPTPYLPGAAYNCAPDGKPGFSSQAEAQKYLRWAPSDPSNLDNDRDGIACQTTSYPTRTRDLTPVPTPAP